MSAGTSVSLHPSKRISPDQGLYSPQISLPRVDFPLPDMGNPAIFPLIYGCQSTDIIVIHINPIVRGEIPRTASDILNRLNEISFNSSLMREMRAIAFANKLVSRGALHDEIKTMLIHARMASPQ